jgi:hypothetical protein
VLGAASAVVSTAVVQGARLHQQRFGAFFEVWRVVDGIGGGVWVVLQGSGRLRWTPAFLGQANLGLRLSPWVVHGGHHRQLAERSCRFVKCASGGLVVGFGGGGAAHSSISGVRPVEGRVVSFV